MSLLRRLRDEGGFTVVEVTVAGVLTVILVFAVLSLLDSGTKSERITQARNDAQTTMRTALQQLTKEARQATYVDPTSDASDLYMKTLIDGVEYWVAYKVVGSPPNATLQRLQCSSPTSSTTISCLSGAVSVQLADRIVAPQAFCYQYDDPDCLSTTPPSTLSAIHVSLQLTPVAFSQGTVTLSTDVRFRNFGS